MEASLVTIRSETQNEFLTSLMNVYSFFDLSPIDGQEEAFFWIGLYKKFQSTSTFGNSSSDYEFQWRWSSSNRTVSSLAYFSWKQDEPNNYW